MKDIRTYLSNYTAASSGFSLGRLKDDPGDGTGSGITVNTHNDFLYAILAPIKKWIGAVAGTDESETASDMMTAIERAAGVANENVAEWSNSTTYAQDAHVMNLGIQFVSMAGSNTGNNPFDNPDKWMPCFGRDEAVRMWRDGRDIDGGFAAVHNKRDTSNYRAFFQWGKYNFGGANGRNFQAYGVHLDGQVLTGNSDYEAIFNIGETDEYHLLDIIAPEVMGTRTMMDSKGRVPRIVDATGGSAANVGVIQADQMQGFRQTIKNSSTNTMVYGFAGTYSGEEPTMNAGRTDRAAYLTSDFVTDGTNGTPRIGTETRMKNYSVGLKSVLVFVEIV